MKSSLTFYPKQLDQNASLIEASRRCNSWAAELACVMGVKSFVTMQHSLRDDEFALLVECGKKTFAAHSKNPRTVFASVSRQLNRYITRMNEQQQKEKRPSRAKSG